MSERVKMILEDVEGVRGSKADLARRYGISRKTLHKWLQRYKEESWDGLKDLSRAPHSHPNALVPEVVATILALKRRYPFWGAPKLRKNLLDRYGGRYSGGEHHQRGLKTARTIASFGTQP